MEKMNNNNNNNNRSDIRNSIHKEKSPRILTSGQQRQQKQNNINKYHYLNIKSHTNSQQSSSQSQNQQNTVQSKLKIPSLRTKIPLRETSNLSVKCLTPPENKRFVLRKKSRTALDINPSNKSIVKQITSTTTVITSPRFRPNSDSLASSRKPEKFLNEAAFNSKHIQFNILKKRLSELQNEFFATFKTLKDIQSKLNGKIEINEKDLPPDEIELVSIVTKQNGEILIKNPNELPSIPTKPNKNLSPKSLSSDPYDIDNIKNKLFTINEIYFKLCKEILNNLRSLTNEIDTANKESGDNKNDLRKQLLNVIESMEIRVSSISEEQQTRIHSVLEELEKISIPKIINDSKTDQEYEQQIQKLNNDIEKLTEDLKISEKKFNELKSTDESVNIEKFKTEILTLKQRIADKDEEIIDMKNLMNMSEEKIHDLEKRLDKSLKSNEEKCLIIKKFENDLENIQERIKLDQNTIEELEKQQQQQNNLEIIQKEKIALKKIEFEKNLRLQYENELEVKNKEIEILKNDLENYKIENSYSVKDHDLDLDDLKVVETKYENLLKEKNEIENELIDLKKLLVDKDDIEIQRCKSNQEINQLHKTNEWLREIIFKLEQIMRKKDNIITELEQKISNETYIKSSTHEIRGELNKLREIEKQKQKEIDSLKKQLSKDQLTIKKQEEKIFMNQRLLKIRCELINSLQEKERLNRACLEDMSPAFMKNSTIIDQMNNEVAAKAEELQNLFSTLGSKQLELSQQKRMIKMLEENNKRLQNLRIKHELKITEQQQEIRNLKEVIKVSNLKHGSSNNYEDNTDVNNKRYLAQT